MMERNILVESLSKLELTKSVAIFCCQMALTPDSVVTITNEKIKVYDARGDEPALAVYIDRRDSSMGCKSSITVRSNALNGEFNLFFETEEWVEDMVTFIVACCIPRVK